MRLNRAETWLMNNPVRAAIQRRFEASRFLDMGGSLDGGLALEVGCGRGVGVEIILEQLGADRVEAFDLDPEQVARARRRLERYGDRVRLWTGSVTDIEAPEGAYDAVVDFGIIHHVPDWRRALKEMHRVLRAGGRLYVEEIYARFILHPLWRRVFRHPETDRFDHADLRAALEATGFEVLEERQAHDHAGWFVATKP